MSVLRRIERAQAIKGFKETKNMSLAMVYGDLVGSIQYLLFKMTPEQIQAVDEDLKTFPTSSHKMLRTIRGRSVKLS